MEEVIKELQTILNNLLKEQDDDIVSDAIRESAYNVSKKDTKVSSGARRIYEDKNAKKHIFATKEKQEEFLHDLRVSYPSVYKRSLDKVLAANMTRTKTIAILVDLTHLLAAEIDQEILDFEALREAFDYIHLNPNTELAIFVHIIKSNAFLHELYGYPIREPNIEALSNYDFQYLTHKQVDDILMHIGIDTFISAEYDAPEEAKKELYEVYKKTAIDYSNRQNLIHELHSLFKKKTADLTEEDFNKIQEIMDKLLFGKLSHRVIKQMKKMQSNLKEEAKTLVNLVVEASLRNKGKKPTEPQKTKLSPKEINQIYYEISKLYDLDKEKAKTTLSLDEIIYLLSLMYRVSMSNKTITNFLESTSREYKKNNPFCIYYQSYDKFKSFALPELQEHLSMIEYILSEVDIFTCSEDEYKETKDLVSIELNAIMDILNGNYSYEIEQAKRLLNKPLKKEK